MNIKKKISIIAIVLFFSSCFGISCARAATGDIEDNWAKKDIEMVLSLGIVEGYTDGLFKPDQMITRAEFVKMLVKAGWMEQVQIDEPAFEDVGPEYWAYPYVQAAYAMGIVTGGGKRRSIF